MAAGPLSMRSRLTEDFDCLANELSASDYVDVLSDQDVEELKGKNGGEITARDFLSCLVTKSEETIAKFFDIVSARQPLVYRKLFNGDAYAEQQGPARHVQLPQNQRDYPDNWATRLVNSAKPEMMEFEWTNSRERRPAVEDISHLPSDGEESLPKVPKREREILKDIVNSPLDGDCTCTPSVLQQMSASGIRQQELGSLFAIRGDFASAPIPRTWPGEVVSPVLAAEAQELQSGRRLFVLKKEVANLKSILKNYQEESKIANEHASNVQKLAIDMEDVIGTSFRLEEERASGSSAMHKYQQEESVPLDSQLEGLESPKFAFPIEKLQPPYFGVLSVLKEEALEIVEQFTITEKARCLNAEETSSGSKCDDQEQEMMTAIEASQRATVLCKERAAEPDEVSPHVEYSQMVQVSQGIARGWRRVARHLPKAFEGRHLEEIALTHGDNQEHAMKMLEKWKDRDGVNATVHALCEALINADYRALAEMVFESRTVKKVRSQIAISKNIGLSQLLFDLSKEIDEDWKDLAVCLDMKYEDINEIEEKFCTEKRAWKMLSLLHSRNGSDFNVEDIRRTLDQIRNNQYAERLKNQIVSRELCNWHKPFCGRKRELEGIDTTFWRPDAAREAKIDKHCLQVVNGMSGSGTSTLGIAYALLNKKMWYGDGIFFFNAESIGTLRMSLRKNLQDVGESLECSENDLQIHFQRFLKYVYRKNKVLLLYDGVRDLNFLEPYLPCNTKCVHVLVTTRNNGDHKILGMADRVTSLGRLSLDSSIEVLQACRGCPGEELDREEAKVAKRLLSEGPIGGLPQAIEYLGQYMKKTQSTSSMCCQQLKSKQALVKLSDLDMNKVLQHFAISSLREKLNSWFVYQPTDLSLLNVADMESKEFSNLCLAIHCVRDVNPMHFPYQLDIKTLKKSHPDAMQFLLYAALTAGKNIPKCLMQQLVSTKALIGSYHLSVCTLMSCSLIEMPKDCESRVFHLHPLVQSTLLECFKDEDEVCCILTNLSSCLLSLLSSYHLDVQQCSTDSRFNCLVPHLYAVAEKAVWVRDEKCCLLVETACNIAVMCKHTDVARHLEDEKLKSDMLANPH